MVKRPQKPKKPPPLPARPGQYLAGTVSLIQEKLIGRTIVSWAKLEGAIDHTIWWMLNFDIEDGRKFTTPMNADRKISFLRLLAETYLDGDQLNTILNTLEKIDLCKDDRNFVAHGIWVRSHPSNEPLVLSIRVKTNPTDVIGESFPSPRLRQLIDDIETARAVLSNLIKQIDSRSPPSPPSESR